MALKVQPLGAPINLQVGPIQQQPLNQGIQLPSYTPLSMGMAPRQPLYVGNTAVQPGGGMTNVRGYSPPPNYLAAPGFGVLRSLAGTGQGLSGLFDLATPGKGTNRASKLFTNAAENIDQTVRDNNVNQTGYRAGQLATDLTQFAAGNELAKGVASIPKVAKVIKPAAKIVSRANPGKDLVGKVAQSVIKQTPGNVGITGLYTGQSAAKGQKVTAKDVLTNLGYGTAMAAGIPLAGAAIKGGAKVTAKAAGKRKPLDQAGGIRNIFGGGGNLHYSSSNGSTSVTGNADKVRSLLRNEGGYAKVPGGKSDPAPDLHPEQKQFINDYAEMLQGMDDTNGGVTIKANGTRQTENSPFYRRTYAEKGRAPTKAEWFDEARNQIESGKAAFGASEDYKTLPSLSKPVEAKPRVTPKSPTEAEFNKMIPAVKGVPDLTPQELADLPANEQLALHAHDTPLNPPEINTARNPYKAPIPEVKQGDYAQVISNEQAASNPVKVAGDRWQATMKKLSPDEKTNFWRAVEQPDNPNYSPELSRAVAAWRNVDDRIHGTSQVLGGNTNYLNNHNLHPWNLPEEYTDHIVNGGDPSNFSGLNNISRKYRTIEEGEANGLTLGTDPVGEGSNYINASAALLKRRAIVKGLGEADGHVEEKTHAFDIGGGNSIPVSAEAMKAVRGIQHVPASTNPLAVGLRTVNTGLKSSILSLGQFHPINISVLRAGPSLVLAGHPVRAAVGVARTFRPLLPGGKGAVERVLQKALDDGMVDKAAKIGALYSQAGYETEGSLLKSGVGHKMVFERQMPMMHDQVVRSVIRDLEKRNVPLDSAEARQAGTAANSTMGFINKEALRVSPRVRRAMGDFMLASQFTPSKVVTLSKVAKGGVAGKYARADVVSNVAAATMLITGVGYLLGQQSDNIRDSLLRALINPAVPTSSKDNKGNNVELRIPLTYTGEIAHLLGIKVKRQADGHLGVDWKPGNAPDTIAEWMRARLSPLASTAVKLKTNTNFANKPLYDPDAPAGQKAIQAGTTLAQGFLPIGAQGIPNTEAVKKHLPGSAQEILDANSPGTNPVLKSIGSSFGFTPRTDQTVGKGLDSSRYFSALDEAQQGLNSHEKAVLELYTGSKKNPVTGKYNVQPNVNDTPAKASALLDQPKVIDKLIAMNAQLAKQGQKVDPLWTASKDEITKVLQYQRMPPGGADRTHWQTLNGEWYNPLADARSAFFNTLPKGDPNKPQAPIAYPDASPDVAAAEKEFFGLTDSKGRAAYIQAHPEVQTQLDAQAAYNNELREAQGYSALDSFQKASPDVQKIIDTYNALPQHDGSKGGNKSRSQWITAHPNEYKQMTDYYTQSAIYSLQKEAGQSQFADTEPSQKLLKDAYNLGQYDIVKNDDGTYSLGSSYSSSGSGGSSKGGSKKYSTYSRSSSGTSDRRMEIASANPYKYSVGLSAGGKKNIGKAQKGKTSTNVSFKGKKGKSKLASTSPKKLKVGLKKSRV